MPVIAVADVSFEPGVITERLAHAFGELVHEEIS